MPLACRPASIHTVVEAGRHLHMVMASKVKENKMKHRYTDVAPSTVEAAGRTNFGKLATAVADSIVTLALFADA